MPMTPTATRTTIPTRKRLVADSGEATDPAPELIEVLAESRRLGFLGPGSVADQLAHALRFGEALVGGWSREAPLVADLGAGGGLPSLPIAWRWPEMRLVLVEASARRASFLVWASVELGVTDRVEVWRGRAEVFGHQAERRGRFDGVVARGFGPPAVTVECAGPLLTTGGRCVISEPPQRRAWPADGLAEVGLVEIEGVPGFARFERRHDSGARYPRPSKAMSRAPLFDMAAVRDAGGRPRSS